MCVQVSSAGLTGIGRHPGEAGAYGSFAVQIHSACITKLRILGVLESLLCIHEADLSDADRTYLDTQNKHRHPIKQWPVCWMHPRHIRYNVFCMCIYLCPKNSDINIRASCIPHFYLFHISIYFS